jgi:hypothetical protein
MALGAPGSRARSGAADQFSRGADGLMLVTQGGQANFRGSAPTSPTRASGAIHAPQDPPILLGLGPQGSDEVPRPRMPEEG